jgi:hypothetical protein
MASVAAETSELKPTIIPSITDSSRFAEGGFPRHFCQVANLTIGNDYN